MKSEIKGIKAAGKKVEAGLLFLGKGEIGVNNLGREVSGKIIVGGKFGRAALMKALTLEATGVVSGEISDELFAEIGQGKSWEIGESFNLKLPFLLVEESSLTLAEDFQGKKVILDPEAKKLYVSANNS